VSLSASADAREPAANAGLKTAWDDSVLATATALARRVAGSAAASTAVRAWDGSWAGAIVRALWSPAAPARPGEGLTLVWLVALVAFSAWAFNISGGGLVRAAALALSLAYVVASRTMGLFLVLAAIPFVPDGAALVLVAGLVLSAVMSRLAAAGRRVRPFARALAGEGRSRLGTAVILFGLLLVVATITSVDPAGSLRYLPVWALAIALYWVTGDLAGDSAALVRAALVLGVTAALAGLYGLYQVAIHVPAERAWIDVALFPEVGTRIFAFWGNPNVFALHLLLTGPLLAASLWTAGSRLARAAVGLALLAAGLALVLTLSRAGWFGLAVAILFLGLMRDVRVVVIGLLAAIGALLIAPDVVLMRAATLARFDDPTAVHRIRIWEASARMIADFWWSGLGLSWRTFKAVYPQYAIGGRVAFHAHSHYLQTLVELGVIGFAVIHWILLRPLVWTVRLARRVRLTPAGTILIAATAALLGSLAFGLAEPVFYLPRPILMAWAVLGLAAAAHATAAGADAGGPAAAGAAAGAGEPGAAAPAAGQRPERGGAS
jgi:O-antigen ligase